MITIDTTIKIISTLLEDAETLENMAACSGISWRSLYEYERGSRAMSLTNLLRLCEAYGMDIQEYYNNCSPDAYLVYKAIIYCGSQINLARAMGYCQQTISKYVRDERQILPHVAYKIAEVTHGAIKANQFSSVKN